MKTILAILPSVFILGLLPKAEADPAFAGRTNVVRNISKFGSYPRWSPKGDLIAFSHTNSPGIWTYDLRTKQTRQIHASGNFPAWNPTEDKIAFWDAGHLWLMNSDGTGAFDTGLRAGAFPQWSPDGKSIVVYGEIYSPHDTLFLIDTSAWTSHELQFAKFGPRRKVGHFCLTREGNILFAQPVAADGWPKNELREYSTRGSLVGSVRVTGLNGKPFGMAVSPKGDFIAFDCGRRGIWITRRDGSDARQVSFVGAMPDWSPDQKSLVFDDSSSTPDIRNGIFIMDLGVELR